MNREKISVSIIIPVYNAEKFLKKCLNSIISQTFKNYEIIIVDDGSTDKSLLICNEFKFQNKNVKIKVLKQVNSGPSKARNMGIKNAVGDFIFFVDADDYLEKNVLKNLVNNVEKETLIKVNYKIICNNKIFKTKIYNGYISKKNFIEKMILNNYPGSVCGCLFERKLIENLNFSENIYFMEDTLFLINYLEKIKKIKFVDGIYYYCLGNQNSITTSNKKIIENIDSFCKALDCISDGLDYKYPNQINTKKVILIEKELAKIDNFAVLKKVMNDKKIENILNKINKRNIYNKIYLFLYYAYKRKKIVIIFIYIKLRKLLKTLKNWRR